MTTEPSTIHLLSLSLDQNLLNLQMGDSLVRQQEYAKHFSHTTILVLNHSTHLTPAHYDKLDILPVNALSQLDLVTRAFFLSKKIYRENPFQLVTAQDPLATGLIGRWLKAKYHLPLNIQIHADLLSKAWLHQRFIHRFYIASMNQTLKKADSIRVVSESLKKSVSDFLSSNLPVCPPVFVAPIRVNLDAFWKPAHYRPQVTKFISVGRLSPEKNFPLLLTAFAEVIKSHPQVHLTIVGDGPEKEKLQHLGGESVTFVGAKKPHEVAHLLQTHDTFVLASLYEGFSLAHIEAFAAGIPVISTPVSAIGELLQPDQTALIVEPADAQHFAQCMTYLIDHPEEVYRFAKNGQLWVKNNLDSTVLVNRWIEGLYKTL